MDNNSISQGYGKRPLWQWIALYVVIGAVVYGFVSYVLLGKNRATYAPASTGVPQTQSY